MDKSITVLGSTGSIGTQTLDVAKSLGLKVCGLTAGKNIDLLEKQAREFRPDAVAIADTSLFKDLKQRLADTNIKVMCGHDGINEITCMFNGDTIVSAISGMDGLMPLMFAIKCGKNVALANKEALVAGGCIVDRELKSSISKIIPIDSEHSAIFQCLIGNDIKSVSKIILTGSGGPFRGKKLQDLCGVKLEDALAHPNWKMGSKITIDSATLMNKGLEVIEAHWLFGISVDKIDVVIHPQSIVHSMVEFVDGSIIAQLAMHDMRIAIQFALTYPARVNNCFPKLNIVNIGILAFEHPDMEVFKCLGLAIYALNIGGSMPAVMNAANEQAVELFLKQSIRFNEIPCIIEEAMTQHNVIKEPSIDDILNISRETKVLISRRCK